MLRPRPDGDHIGGGLPILSTPLATLAATLILVTNASAAASPVQIVSATVNADRSVSVSWNIPASPWGGDLVINPTSATDSTGEMPFRDTTFDYQIFGSGRTHYHVWVKPVYGRVYHPPVYQTQCRPREMQPGVGIASKQTMTPSDPASVSREKARIRCGA